MINQLQQQFQRLRDEVNTISQLAAQLQQAEQTNSAQLQQLQQKEIFASQNLQRIQYLASQLHQNIIQASNIAQQLTGAAAFPQTQAAYQYTSPTGYTPIQYQTGTGWSATSPAYMQTAYTGQAGAYQRGYGTPYTTQYGYAYSPGQTEITAQYSTPQTGYTTQYTGTPGQWGTLQSPAGQFSQERENQLIFGAQAGYGTQMQAGWSGPARAGFAGSQPAQMTQYSPGFTGAHYYGQYTGISPGQYSQF